jgi:hypothetical protein
MLLRGRETIAVVSIVIAARGEIAVASLSFAISLGLDRYCQAGPPGLGKLLLRLFPRHGSTSAQRLSSRSMSMQDDRPVSFGHPRAAIAAR